MKSNVYVGPSLRRNDAIEYTRARARTGEGGLAGDFASINTPRFFHTSLRSKNSCAGPFAMETQKSHFFLNPVLFRSPSLFLFREFGRDSYVRARRGGRMKMTIWRRGKIAAFERICWVYFCLNIQRSQ